MYPGRTKPGKREGADEQDHTRETNETDRKRKKGFLDDRIKFKGIEEVKSGERKSTSSYIFVSRDI